MKVIVDGKVAALEASATFEYKQENPLFTNAEGYSMELTFPMKDNPDNILIFGPLHVKGVDITKVTFPCEMVCEAFDKSGILTIIEVADMYVKGQFLEGMSAENFQTSADLLTYLTDLDFSQWDGQSDDWDGFPTGYYTAEYDSEWGTTTWKKDLTKSGPAAGWDQAVIYDKSHGKSMDHMDGAPSYAQYIQRHIYLAHLVDLVGRVIGWTVDQQVLRSISYYQYILVANRRRFLMEFPYRWKVRPLCDSLPRWTVKEFFQNIADYFGCIVDYNSTTKVIAFRSYKQVVGAASGNIPEVALSVTDDFTVEVSDEEEGQYKGAQHFKLPDECNPGNVNSCPWAFDDPRIPIYNCTKKWLLDKIAAGAQESWKDDPVLAGLGVDGRYIFYLTDLQRYVVVTQAKKYWIGGEPEPNEYGSVPDPDYVFQCIEVLNQYGGHTDGTELKVCNCPFETVKYYRRDYPTDWSASIQNSYYGYLPALDIPVDPLERVDTNEWGPDYPQASENLSSGERKMEDMYFDKLWIFLMRNTSQSANGSAYTREYEPRNVPGQMLEPVPGYDYMRTITDEDGNPIEYPYTVALDKYQYTLSPNSSEITVYRDIPKVDETKLYRYNFLAKTLPSVTSIFVIKGKRYACLRIIVHFTNTDMSELVEGEFYEIVG